MIRGLFYGDLRAAIGTTVNEWENNDLAGMGSVPPDAADGHSATDCRIPQE